MYTPPPINDEESNSIYKDPLTSDQYQIHINEEDSNEENENMPLLHNENYI
jgi:hypothetical protein